MVQLGFDRTTHYFQYKLMKGRFWDAIRPQENPNTLRISNMRFDNLFNYAEEYRNFLKFINHSNTLPPKQYGLMLQHKRRKKRKKGRK